MSEIKRGSGEFLEEQVPKPNLVESNDVQAEDVDPTPSLNTRFNRFILKHREFLTTATAMLFAAGLGIASGRWEKEAKELPEIEQYAHWQNLENDKDAEIGQQIYEKVGALAVQEMQDMDSIHDEQERREVLQLPFDTKAVGFERSKFVTNEQMEYIIENTYPKGFNRNINSVRYQYAKESNVGIPDEGEINSPAAGDANPMGQIRIFDIAGEGPHLLHYVVNHEVFHMQDWNHNKLLTLSERVWLHNKIIERVKSEGRFYSEYVENIKTDDPQYELKRKAEEYWAEIGSQYFTYGDNGLLPYEDAQLVRWVIMKTDPGYNLEEKNASREMSLQPPIKINAKFSPKAK